MIRTFIVLLVTAGTLTLISNATTVANENDEIVSASEEVFQNVSPTTEMGHANRSAGDQLSGSASSSASCEPGSVRMCARTRCVDHVTRKVSEIPLGSDVKGQGHRFPCSSTKACPVGKFCICSKFRCTKPATVPGEGNNDLPTCRCPCDKGPCPEPCAFGACTLQACYPMPLPCDKE